MANPLAGTSAFAHLLGRPAAAKRAEEDEDERKKDEEARAKAKAAEDEDKKKDEEARAKAEEDEDKRKKDEEVRKKAKAEGDDEDDEDDAKASAARRRERARCAAIFASPHAAVRPDVAAALAFGTDMSRAEACNVLAAVAAGEAPRAARGAGRLAERMDRSPNPDVGTPGEAPAANDPAAVAQRMLASAAKARGA